MPLHIAVPKQQHTWELDDDEDEELLEELDELELLDDDELDDDDDELDEELELDELVLVLQQHQKNIGTDIVILHTKKRMKTMYIL